MRGGIIFKILEISEYHKPNFILLENVHNLITINNGECIKKITNMFENIGYNVKYEKLNSKDFKCPQSRERVYIMCTLQNEIDLTKIKNCKKETRVINEIIDISYTKTNVNYKFTKKIIDYHKLHSVYGCKIGDKRGGVKNINSWDIELNGKLTSNEKLLMNQIMRERRKKHWAVKKNIAWMDGMPLTKDEIKTFNDSPNLSNMLNNLTELNYLRIEKPKDLIYGKRVYKVDSQDGYNICKGKLSFPISAILDPQSIAPTLTATDSHKLGILINDNILRQLTSDEIKKICGFPDSFIVPTHVNYFDLFGNMATPPVLEILFRLLFDLKI